MAIPYKEAFEFGDFNPIRDTSTKEYVYDNLPGSGLKALSRTISKGLERNTSKSIGKQIKGIVLRVEKPEIKEANAWDLRIENMAAFAISGGEIKDQGAANTPPRIRLKIRIPELHATLPIPAELPDYGESNPNHTIIDMYPTFIAKSNQLPEPKAGDIVWVEFGNSLTQEDPIYTGPLVSNQVPMYSGPPMSAGGAFATGGGAGGGGYQQPGPLGDLSPIMGPTGPTCGGAPCTNMSATNWGRQTLNVAIGSLGWGESHGDAAGPFIYMVKDVGTRTAKAGDVKKPGKEGYDEHSGPHNPNHLPPAKGAHGKRTEADWVKKGQHLADVTKTGNPRQFSRGHWCSNFITFCLIRAAERMGLTRLESKKYMQGSGGCTQFARYAKKRNLMKIPFYNWSTGQFMMENLDLVAPGDIILFSNSQVEQRHIAIVEYWEKATGILHCIDGNTGKANAPTKRRIRAVDYNTQKQLHPGSHLVSKKFILDFFLRLPQVPAVSDPQSIPSAAEIWNGYPLLYELTPQKWYDAWGKPMVTTPAQGESLAELLKREAG